MRHVVYAIAAFYGAATMVLALALCRTAAEGNEPEIEDFFGKGY